MLEDAPHPPPPPQTRFHSLLLSRSHTAVCGSPSNSTVRSSSSSRQGSWKEVSVLPDPVSLAVICALAWLLLSTPN